MLNELDYFIGWGVYIVAACGCLLVFWRMSRNLPWQFFKQCLRLAVAVIVLVPVIVQPTSYYAPAWLVGVFELLTGNAELAVKVFAWIGKWLALGVGVYLLLFMLGYLLFPSRRRRIIYHPWPQNPQSPDPKQAQVGQKNSGQQNTQQRNREPQQPPQKRPQPPNRPGYPLRNKPPVRR